MATDLIFLKRRIINAIALLLSAAAALLGLACLAWILWTTLSKGIAAFNIALFTQMTPPPGEAGGLANALFGSPSAPRPPWRPAAAGRGRRARERAVRQHRDVPDRDRDGYADRYRSRHLRRRIR